MILYFLHASSGRARLWPKTLHTNHPPANWGFPRFCCWSPTIFHELLCGQDTWRHPLSRWNTAQNLVAKAELLFCPCLTLNFSDDSPWCSLENSNFLFVDRFARSNVSQINISHKLCLCALGCKYLNSNFHLRILCSIFFQNNVHNMAWNYLFLVEKCCREWKEFSFRRRRRIPAHFRS